MAMGQDEREGPGVVVETLKPGDVVVAVWHDAAEWRDCPTWFSPENIGHPGVRRLLVGIVITNGDGWLRLAETLTYFRDKEERGQVETRNTYYEIPWAWFDKVFLCGSFEELLLDLWEKAGV